MQRKERPGSQDGFTLIEVMVASVLLLIAFFGMARYAAGSRTQLSLEEGRRHAVAVAQGRLESIKRGETYDTLGTLTGRDTTYTVDGRPYAVTHTIELNTPEEHAATVGVTVTWSEMIGGNATPRSVGLTAIVSRSLIWEGGS